MKSGGDLLPGVSVQNEAKFFEESQNKKRIRSYALLTAISLARIGGGLFLAIHGPTLLSLANNVSTSVGTVAYLFSGRSFGVLTGGIATGFIMRKFNNMYTFGLSTFILAAVLFVTPWISHLWLLVVVVMFGGIVYGYLDAGMQALILQIWGEKDSRGLVSGYHFMIAVGAFMAPFIAQPFLKQEDDSVCPASDSPLKQTVNSTEPYQLCYPTDFALAKQASNNPVVWAYLICAIFLVFVGFCFILLAFLKTEKRIRSVRQEFVESRREDSVKTVAPLFALVCLYYFFCVAGEMAYNSYIYSVSICSDLQFSVNDGTLVNAVFWIGFGSGRLTGVLILKYLKPALVIIINFVGTIISMIIVCIFGQSHPPVTWAITFLYSFFQATIYPAGVSWTSQYTNMSRNYTFVFSIGQALGSMVLLTTGGLIFDVYPFGVMYMILGCSLVNASTFIGMTMEGRRLAKKHAKVLKNGVEASTFDDL